VLALLYDVHGNLPALEAVLGDATAQGASSYLLGGDYALFGAWPAETVARLRKLEHAQWLRGNCDRWAAAPDDAPGDEPVSGAVAACREQLGEEQARSLGELPELIGIGEALACHASPVSDMRSFLPQPADDEPELLAGVTAPRLIFGHTHLPFARRSLEGIELINPGSVGMPFDGDTRAAYALVHDDGAVEHRRVAYDHRASAAALRERFDGAWTATVAARIEQARFDAST
jgi:putative phosphoesterase